MKKVICVLLSCLFSMSSGCNTAISPSESESEYDVVVYGGTSAGVIAAYTAKKMGKSVVLIEQGNRLGGLTTGGLGYTDIGNKYAITGLSRDFYRRIGDHYGKFEQWIFEPHVAEAVFLDYIKRADIEVLYQHRIVAAHKKQGAIETITLEKSESSAPSDNKVIKGKMFIDCSYEGDLMARAGVSYAIGRENNSKYNETYNGVQLMGGHQFPDGVDPYKVEGKPESGLLWGITDEPLQPQGSGDKKIQAYNYRITLTDDVDNMIPITRPEGYDSTRYELLLRLFQAQPKKRSLHDYFIWSRMPNNKTDINNRGGFSTDMIGMNYAYPEASYEERAEIIIEHTAYTKGLLYFYGHDPRVPKEMREKMVRWGYPADEYKDHGHWSPQLYVREVRRMVGEYVMTQANAEGDEVVTDGIGMAAYTMDSHNTQRLVIEKGGKRMVKNEGNVEVGGFGPYPISYRSIIPKSEDCKNLLVPVAISASHIAYGSIRMEPVFMVLAQSSAVAASIAIDMNQAVQEVDVDKVQKLLLANPLVDGSIAEVLVDNEDEESIRMRGNWEEINKGSYGPSMLVDESKADADKAVQFIPEIMEKGEYNIYAYFPQLENGTDKTYINVFDGEFNKEVVINKSDILVEGQTSGEWVSLGKHELPKGEKAYVEITNRNATGAVVADAVLFVPSKK